MTVSMRGATPDDLPGVLDVFLGCWRQSYRGILPEDALDAMTDDRATALWRRVLSSPVGHVVLAEDEGSGQTLGITRFAGDGATGHVHSLYVSPEAQGRGIGRLLLDHAVDALRQEGADHAFLWVFAANQPSIGFYESRGWSADGTTRIQDEFGALEQRMRRSAL